MNWQQILTLFIVLGVAVIFIWRSSDPKKHSHGCNCGCAPEDDAETPKDKTIH